MGRESCISNRGRQLRRRSAPAPQKAARIVTIAIGPNRIPVYRVDPKTRQATTDRQQFLYDDGRLEILPQSKWIADPVEIWTQAGFRAR